MDGTASAPPGASRPRRVGAVVLGLVAIGVSIVGVVTLPVVVAVVAAWWATLDARDVGPRAPGRLGKVALALLAVVWGAAAVLVLSFDTHFDCGGTLGGFGEAADARLDEGCVDRRSWRTLVGLAGVVAGATAVGIVIRRRARRADARGVGDRRHVADAVSTVAGLVLAWLVLVAVLVAT